MLLQRVVPPADKPVAGWHVSPLVDLAAYHFSWLWILIPLALSGDQHPKDYLALWAVGMTFSLVHRYYTLPYVFLDKQIFKQHVTRFTLFFFLLNLGSVAGAFLYRFKAPKHFFHPVDVALAIAGAALVVQCVVADKRGHKFSTRALCIAAAPFALACVLGVSGVLTASHEAVASTLLALFAFASIAVAVELGAIVFPIVTVIAAACGVASVALTNISLNDKPVSGAGVVGVVGVIAVLWNVWHTLMQKFGIMRMYAAKSAVPVDQRTPKWVDRFLIFGSFPLLAVIVGPQQRDTILHQSKSVTQYLVPALDGLEYIQYTAWPFAALLAAASIATFVWYERRAGFTLPRMSMAVALTLLNASFLFFSPLKVYVAYGFSHAIEYMVFVWAFLRRRYAQPLEHRPLLQRLLARPLLFYGAYTAAIGVTYFVIEFGKDFGLHQGGISIFGIKIGVWLFSFAIWQSLAHFYFDGFLWKMRAPAVRASL